MAKSGKNKGFSYRYNKSGTVTCRAYFDMPDNTRQQISATGKTEAEARRKLEQKYANICKKGKKIKIKSYTVETWLMWWLNNVKTNLKGNTKDSYYSSFTNHIFPILAKVKLTNLSLMTLQQTANKIKNKNVVVNGKKQKISGKAVKEIFAPFKQALQYAMEEDLMPDINLKKIDLPRVKKGTRKIRNKTEAQVVTDYFSNKIPDNPFDIYYAPLVVMDLRGLRPEEVGGLRWQDIQYATDTFWAGNHTVVKNGIYDENGKKIGEQIVVEDSAKTPHGVRELPLGKFLANIFKAKYQEYIDKGITPKPTDFIFITQAGNPYYEQSLRKMYSSLAKKLGISDLGCYSFRHEYATALARDKKFDRETVKQLMGWSEIVESYFHTDDEQKRKATESIDAQYENKDEENTQIQYKDNVIIFPSKRVVNK